MAPKLLAKPLTATVRERLRDKAHRIAPPTAQQIASVHRLPVRPEPSEPTPAKEPAKPMAKKRKMTRHPDDYKAKIVARALKAKETGDETISAIAHEEGIYDSNIYNWIAAAKKANGTPAAAGAKDKGKGDLKSLSRELAEAMDRVTSIKKKMRKLLEE